MIIIIIVIAIVTITIRLIIITHAHPRTYHSEYTDVMRKRKESSRFSLMRGHGLTFSKTYTYTV